MSTDTVARAGGSEASGPIALIVILAATMYFLPSIIAMIRHVNTGSVIVINLLLGWTFIGWVCSLAMACASTPATLVLSQQYQPVYYSPPAYAYPPMQPPIGRPAQIGTNASCVVCGRYPVDGTMQVAGQSVCEYPPGAGQDPCYLVAQRRLGYLG